MSDRSGSENRQRIHQINVRLNDPERDNLEALAKREGVSLADMFRTLLSREVWNPTH